MIIPVKGMTVTVDGVLVPVEGLTVEVPDLPANPTPTSNGGGEELAPIPFVPVIGGDSESGQVYSTQRGYYVRSKYKCDVKVYVQFSSKGTINGNLRLKNLPVPAATIPMFFAGDYAYSSNASPQMNAVSNILVYTAGTLDYAMLYGFVPSQNPRPLTAEDINDHTQIMLGLSYFVDAPMLKIGRVGKAQRAKQVEEVAEFLQQSGRV